MKAKRRHSYAGIVPVIPFGDLLLGLAIGYFIFKPAAPSSTFTPTGTAAGIATGTPPKLLQG